MSVGLQQLCLYNLFMDHNSPISPIPFTQFRQPFSPLIQSRTLLAISFYLSMSLRLSPPVVSSSAGHYSLYDRSCARLTLSAKQVHPLSHFHPLLHTHVRSGICMSETAAEHIAFEPALRLGARVVSACGAPKDGGPVLFYGIAGGWNAVRLGENWHRKSAKLF